MAADGNAVDNAVETRVDQIPQVGINGDLHGLKFACLSLCQLTVGSSY